MQDRSDIKITVLRGGPSSEREISMVSGGAVADACRRLGYTVQESDIGPDDLSALELPCDAVFPVLHGCFGEDGQVQALLEQRGIPYVGSDSVSSRLSMDKCAAKNAWKNANLPTAPWSVLDSPEQAARMIPTKEFPVILKPIAEGSSVGVRLCDTADALREQFDALFPRYGSMMIEKRLYGPELTVGILEQQVLPVIRIKPPGEFFDHESKYYKGETDIEFNPVIPGTDCAEIQRIALAAFQTLGCRDYGRIDFIIDETLGPQLLEINTIPGFTPLSMLPKAANKIGIEFDPLVDRLLRLALARKEKPSD